MRILIRWVLLTFADGTMHVLYLVLYAYIHNPFATSMDHHPQDTSDRPSIPCVPYIQILGSTWARAFFLWIFATAVKAKSQNLLGCISPASSLHKTLRKGWMGSAPVFIHVILRLACCKIPFCSSFLFFNINFLYIFCGINSC